MVNLGTLFGRTRGRGSDENAATIDDQPADSEVIVDRPSRPVRILFACWVAFDAVLVIGLACWNVTLTSSAWDLIGSALLFVIGVTCALALGQILAASKSVLITSLASQIFVAGLAVYVWMVDLRSPVRQLLGITGIALAIGGISLLWVLYLARYARGATTKAAAVVVALFPLAGLAQFWLQTDYLPSASHPPIDVDAELTPMGSTGPIIHLLAKVTIHNRGSMQVDLHAGLMRVTSYPLGTPTQTATEDTLAADLNPLSSTIGASYRETPALPKDARLLYAEILATPYAGGFVPSGGTAETKRVIDVDSRTVRLVRLSATGVFVTHRMMKDTSTCSRPEIYFSQDPDTFMSEAMNTSSFGDAGARVLCTKTQFTSRGAIDALVSDHPVLKTLVVVKNPLQTMELPQLLTYFGTRESVDTPLDVKTPAVVEQANPADFIPASAEYEPSDADLHRGPG